jgi:titin
VLETVEYRAPSPPVNLSDRFDRRRVYLEWEPPEDDGGQPVTHYTVLRGDGPSDLEELANTTLTTYTDTTVEVGRYYYYAVRATNPIGTGETCGARRVRADYVVPPSSPEGPSAAYLDGVVVIDWSAPVDDGGDPITGYVLERGSSPGDLEHLADVGLVTNYSDPDVEPDVMYYYTVSAVNGMGAGPPCAKVTAYVPAIEPPSTPAGVALEFIQDRIKVSWQPSEDDGGSPVTGYRVLRGVDEDDLEQLALVTVGTTYYDLQVERGRTYRYAVVAMNAEEESGPSDEVTLRVPREVTEDGLTVSWYLFGAMAAAAAVVLVVAFVALHRRDRGSA